MAAWNSVERRTLRRRIDRSSAGPSAAAPFDMRSVATLVSLVPLVWVKR
jgi:hypothetical protein